MADTKISALTAASALAAADIAPVVQGGANVKATVQQLVTAATGSTAFPGETLTTSKPAVDLAQTWNASGTAFTGVKFNATDTASAAGSLLMDLQVGGVSRFNVSKVGTVTINPLGFQAIIQSTTGASLSVNGGNMLVNAQLLANSIGATLLNSLNWTSSNIFNPVDLSLFRDAAQTLAQRNGTNAQTFRLYNTFTDASNLERAKFAWESNVLRIGTEKLGTGTARNLEFQTDGVTRLIINASGSVQPQSNFENTLSSSSFGTGASATTWVRLGSGTSSRSQLRFSSGVAPTTPQDGDVWFDGSNLKMQIAGVIKTFTMA
jgi:hypothetical protein